MTNSAKIKEIHDVVIKAAIERSNTKDTYNSAEWIYKKGWSDAMVRIKTIVCDIIDQEED